MAAFPDQSQLALEIFQSLSTRRTFRTRLDELKSPPPTFGDYRCYGGSRKIKCDPGNPNEWTSSGTACNFTRDVVNEPQISCRDCRIYDLANTKILRSVGSKGPSAGGDVDKYRYEVIIHLMALMHERDIRRPEDKESFREGVFKCDECYKEAYLKRNNTSLAVNGSTFRGDNCAGCPARENRQRQLRAEQEQGQLHQQQNRLEPERQTGQEPTQLGTEQLLSTMQVDNQSQQSDTALPPTAIDPRLLTIRLTNTPYHPESIVAGSLTDPAHTGLDQIAESESRWSELFHPADNGASRGLFSLVRSAPVHNTVSPGAPDDDVEMQSRDLSTETGIRADLPTRSIEPMASDPPFNLEYNPEAGPSSQLYPLSTQPPLSRETRESMEYESGQSGPQTAGGLALALTQYVPCVLSGFGEDMGHASSKRRRTDSEAGLTSGFSVDRRASISSVYSTTGPDGSSGLHHAVQAAPVSWSAEMQNTSWPVQEVPTPYAQPDFSSDQDADKRVQVGAVRSIDTFTLFPEDFTVGGFSPYRLSDDGDKAQAIIRPDWDPFFWINAADAGLKGSIIKRKQEGPPQSIHSLWSVVAHKEPYGSNLRKSAAPPASQYVLACRYTRIFNLTCDFILPEGRYNIIFYFRDRRDMREWNLNPATSSELESFNWVRFAMGTKLTRAAYLESKQARDAQALGRVSFDRHRVNGQIQRKVGLQRLLHGAWHCGTYIFCRDGSEAKMPVVIGSDIVADDPKCRRVRLVITFPDADHDSPPQPKGMFLFHGVRFVPYT